MNNLTFFIILYYERVRIDYGTIFLFPRFKMNRIQQVLLSPFRKKNLSCKVSLLICFFAASSWLTVSSIFIELPLLVKTLPEQWTLPSYLAFITQCGNLAPILYGLLHKYCANTFREVRVIYGSISLAILLSLLLSITWSETAHVSGVEHSLALFTLMFFVACIACSTSVTFLPFMARFKGEYLTAFYFGQGLSGLLPSLVALIQGVGEVNVRCVYPNATSSIVNNNSLANAGSANDISSGKDVGKVVSESMQESRFGVSGFFVFVIIMNLISLLSFIGLNLCEFSKKVMLNCDLKQKADEITNDLAINESKPVLSDDCNSETQVEAMEDETEEMTELETIPNNSSAGLVYQETVEEVKHSSVVSAKWIAILLIIQALLSSQTNGIFQAILSFSCLPYGGSTYHLSVTLSACIYPVASVVYNYYSVRSPVTIIVLFFTSTSILAYIVAMAVLSPCPLLIGNASGGIIMVSVAK